MFWVHFRYLHAFISRNQHSLLQNHIFDTQFFVKTFRATFASHRTLYDLIGLCLPIPWSSVFTSSLRSFIRQETAALLSILPENYKPVRSSHSNAKNKTFINFPKCCCCCCCLGINHPRRALFNVFAPPPPCIFLLNWRVPVNEILLVPTLKHTERRFIATVSNCFRIVYWIPKKKTHQRHN